MKKELQAILERLSTFLTTYGDDLQKTGSYRDLSEVEDSISNVLEEMPG